MTKEQLNEVQARADAATPGPWSISRHGEVWDVTGEVIQSDILIPRCYPPEHEDNKRFIAHSRKDIPALIAEVKRLTPVWHPIDRTTDKEGNERWSAEILPEYNIPVWLCYRFNGELRNRIAMLSVESWMEYDHREWKDTEWIMEDAFDDSCHFVAWAECPIPAYEGK